MVLTRTTFGRELTLKMFNRKVKAMQRSRVVDAPLCDIHRLCAEQLVERRAFIKRETPVVLEVGAHTGWYLRALLASKQLFGLKQYIQTDISEERLNLNYQEVKDIIPPGVEFVQICCDEEEMLLNEKTGEFTNNPFGIPDRSVDMVVSNLSLHWANDLETAVTAIRRALKRDAFALMTMFGGNTLFELRSSLTLAQVEIEGSVAPHVSPMIDGTGVSSLMVSAGFALPSVDMDRHVLMYESPFQLMEHLQAMGESACHLERVALRRDVLAACDGIYRAMYLSNNLIPATFEVFHVLGWSPSPNQAQPLPRGTGAVPMGSIATAEHRELQKALNEFAANPDDASIQARAEELLGKLNEGAREVFTRTHSAEAATVRKLSDAMVGGGSKKEKLPPPFQEDETPKTAAAPTKQPADDGKGESK